MTFFRKNAHFADHMLCFRPAAKICSSIVCYSQIESSFLNVERSTGIHE